MAIQPPSDILLDVANAADPVAVRAATARLAALAADPGAANAGFSEALGQAAKGGRAAAPSGPLASSAAANSPAASSPAATLAALPSPVGGGHSAPRPPHPDRKFEAVLLQSFVESMLPKESELFGDKESSGVYRSMMAEQLANQIAAAGGIGLAKSLESKHPAAPPDGAASAAGVNAATVPSGKPA